MIHPLSPPDKPVTLTDDQLYRMMRQRAGRMPKNGLLVPEAIQAVNSPTNEPTARTTMSWAAFILYALVQLVYLLVNVALDSKTLTILIDKQNPGSHKMFGLIDLGLSKNSTLCTIKLVMPLCENWLYNHPTFPLAFALFLIWILSIYRISERSNANCLWNLCSQVVVLALSAYNFHNPVGRKIMNFDVPNFLLVMMVQGLMETVFIIVGPAFGEFAVVDDDVNMRSSVNAMTPIMEKRTREHFADMRKGGDPHAKNL
jgi:hypothetical protein